MGGVPSTVLEVEVVKVVRLAVDKLTQDDVVAAEPVVENVTGTKTVGGLNTMMLDTGPLMISSLVLVGDTPEVSDDELVVL